VPRTAITLDCPDRPKVTTTTSATGEFRFEDLGAGAPDDCIVEVDGHGSWIAPLRLGSRCTQHDATSGLCTEARFAFEMP
jgi:hypothetical protein